MQGLLKNELVHGAYYIGHCRNATEARWHEKWNCFVHWRVEWNFRFLEAIPHPDDEQKYDVFVATELTTNPKEPFDFPNTRKELL